MIIIFIKNLFWSVKLFLNIYIMYGSEKNKITALWSTESFHA